MPLSHRGKVRLKNHYGGKFFTNPVRAYKGGGSVAKGARFESTMPLSHRGKVRLKNHYGGKFFTDPVKAYRGGGSVAQGARFESTIPLPHRGNRAEKRRYGGPLAIEPALSYKGEKRNGPSDAPSVPIRIRRKRSDPKRYGGKIQLAPPSRYAGGRGVSGTEPVVPWPPSYQKQRKTTPGKSPIIPPPVVNYIGSAKNPAGQEPEPAQRKPHRKLSSKPEKYGVKQYPGNPPSYKGK